jgi:TolA-binding protein
MTPGLEGLLARIRPVRRTGAPRHAVKPPPASASEPEANRLQDLQARIAHLEQLVQGLQDSVYRESQRQEKRISELEVRTEPAALAAALSKDARERGL